MEDTKKLIESAVERAWKDAQKCSTPLEIEQALQYAESLVRFLANLKFERMKNESEKK